MYNFTVLERMVLESINKSGKTLDEVQEDTGLGAELCLNVVFSLSAKNLIVTKADKYLINENLCEGILSELKDAQNKAVELNMLVRECVKDTIIGGGESFGFKKVYMDEKEKKLLKAMLYNLESFLDGLKDNKGKTKDETFVFWGKENYGKAILDYIS